MDATHLSHRSALPQPGEIVIACGDGNEAGVLSCGVVGFVFLKERHSVTATLEFEEGVGNAMSLADLAPATEEMVVGGLTDRDHKIDVEACSNGLRGVTPLGDQNGLRIILVEPGADVVPQVPKRLAVGRSLD